MYPYLTLLTSYVLVTQKNELTTFTIGMFTANNSVTVTTTAFGFCIDKQ